MIYRLKFKVISNKLSKKHTIFNFPRDKVLDLDCIQSYNNRVKCNFLGSILFYFAESEILHILNVKHLGKKGLMKLYMHLKPRF